MKKIALLLYTVIVLVLAASCDRRAEYLTASGAMLGTTFQATGDITDCSTDINIFRSCMEYYGLTGIDLSMGSRFS